MTPDKLATTPFGVPLIKILIPRSIDTPDAPCVIAETGFEVLARRGAILFIMFTEMPSGTDWFGEFELMYCRLDKDNDTFKVIRKAEDYERKLYRIRAWIQGEEVPECCGRPMHFVGQIDDDDICKDAPDEAEVWWHDAASFYVFTCGLCLSCKAVGQQ